MIDTSHVFNAVNALSADVHRLSEVNRLSTLKIEGSLTSSVDANNLYTTTTLLSSIADLQTRVEELHEELSGEIDSENIENKIDDLLGQVADLPDVNTLGDELTENFKEMDSKIKAE